MSDLPDRVQANLDAVERVHDQALDDLTSHERFIDRFTDTIGSPRTVYAIILFIAGWVVANVFLGERGFDPKPFELMQAILAAFAAIVTTMVLAAQSVQRKLGNQRAHLELQVNLLAEHKASKIISMLEELRADSPHISNKRDREAEQLDTAIDAEQLHEAVKDRGAR